MLELQTISAILFLIILALFVYIKRKNLDTKQIIPYFLYFSMYKTTWGLKLMDSLAKKHRKFMLYVGYFGILVGFLGMLLISYGLINSIYVLFTKPSAAPGVGLVLPFKAKGTFFVPFFYWIISIFVIAVVHEFAHGLIARTHNLKVKSSGFAFVGSGFRGAGFLMIIFSVYFKIRNSDLSLNYYNFLNYTAPEFWLLLGLIFVVISYLKLEFSSFAYIPIIPAAFVEPDEKELRKRPHKEQLSVFAAGPLTNIIVGFLCLGIFLLIFSTITGDGVKVAGYVEEKGPFPAQTAGIKIGEVIKEVDGIKTPYTSNLSMILKTKKPEDVVAIKTDKSTYQLKLAKNPENESVAYMGAYLDQNIKLKYDLKGFGAILSSIIVWLSGLFYFLYVLNLGIGLFNLVPIGPIDGGRMLQLVLHKIFDKEKGDKVWYCIGVFFFILIFVNIVAGFVR